MSEQCNQLKQCEFFNRFQGNLDVLKDGWIEGYCNNLEKSETCERNKIFKKTGMLPPDNVTPTGSVIEEKDGLLNNLLE